MSDKDEWTFQLSVKVEGFHLLNIRANDGVGFKDALAWATENREPILAACAALEGARKPQAEAPRQSASRQPIVSPGASEKEMGPLVLENVEIKRSGKDGLPWKNPMFILKFEGTSASTFDQLIGKAAQGFWTAGAQCYVTTAPSPKNPKYSNVVSIRSAVVS